MKLSMFPSTQQVLDLCLWEDWAKEVTVRLWSKHLRMVEVGAHLLLTVVAPTRIMEAWNLVSMRPSTVLSFLRMVPKRMAPLNQIEGKLFRSRLTSKTISISPLDWIIARCRQRKQKQLLPKEKCRHRRCLPVKAQNLGSYLTKSLKTNSSQIRTSTSRDMKTTKRNALKNSMRLMSSWLSRMSRNFDLL